MASRLLFKIPDAHLQVLDSLYVDNLVYVEHWRDAMTAIHEEWLMCSYWVSMIPQMYAAEILTWSVFSAGIWTDDVSYSRPLASPHKR